MTEPRPKDLTEHFVSGEEVFSGGFIKVRRDVVRLPDGSHGVREFIRHPGAVMVIPLFPNGDVLLERQFRYPHGRDFIELPAGKLEPGEPHLETAKRELLEETGYVAAEWTRLTVLHTTIAYTDEAIELWLAKGLRYEGQRLDEGEFLEVLKLPFEEALAMVKDGRITDAKSMAGLLWLQAFKP
ncbi:MAG: NUDIX hydrolase [Betaproteobacteria bacterium]|nr:NUDIX hydrolase [Betaproteobacteria bacterium]